MGNDTFVSFKYLHTIPLKGVEIAGRGGGGGERREVMALLHFFDMANVGWTNLGA